MKTNTLAEGRDKDDGKKDIARMSESTKLVEERLLIQSRQAALAVQDELNQWERLSDEALVDFEKELP